MNREHELITDGGKPKPMTESIVERHDIDESDDISQDIFQLILKLRKEGATPKEIVPRLRDHADNLEEHFEDSDSWDHAPVDRDVTLPGDSDG